MIVLKEVMGYVVFVFIIEQCLFAFVDVEVGGDLARDGLVGRIDSSAAVMILIVSPIAQGIAFLFVNLAAGAVLALWFCAIDLVFEEWFVNDVGGDVPILHSRGRPFL